MRAVSSAWRVLTRVPQGFPMIAGSSAEATRAVESLLSGGARSVTPSPVTGASLPIRSMLDRRKPGTARRATGIPEAGSAAARSVGGAQVTAPTPFDHLFAALAPRNGWLHSPGSVEATVTRLRMNQEVVLAVGGGTQSPDELAGSLAAAQLLGRICRDAGKDVSILLDGSLPTAVRSAFERTGLRLLSRDEGVPGSVTARGALTAPGRRLLVSFGENAGVPTGAPDPRSDIQERVVLSRYPLVSEILASGRDASDWEAVGGRAHTGEQVSAPSGGEAGFAVAVRLASQLNGIDAAPDETEFVDAVSQMRRLVVADARLVGRSARGASVSDAAAAENADHLSARAELIRAIGVSCTDARSSNRPLSPYLVAAFDSSNGGLIAARNAAGYMKQALADLGVAREVSFVIVADHGNAPYGSKSPGELAHLVTAGLTGSALLRPDAVLMACNTACTAFPAALNRMRTTEDRHVPVVDLIDVTVGEMVRWNDTRGGRLALFATKATVDHASYQDKLAQNGVRNVTAVGCPGWAELVNEGRHTSRTQADTEFVADVIRERVSKLASEAPDVTSVWLCCTHYPALKANIEQALHDQFGGRKIEVIDPMEFQAKRVAELLAGLGGPREIRGDSNPFTVLTTGDVAEVKAGADAVFGAGAAGDGVRVFATGAGAFDAGGRLSAADGVSLASLRRALLGLPSAGRDALLSAYVLRGIDRFAQAGGPAKLAGTLQGAGHVMLLTGFSVAQDKPETDGPPGTAVLAKALSTCGKQVTVVVDAGNESAMRASLGAILPPDHPGVDVRVFRSTPAEAAAQALALLDDTKPAAVVAIELPGRNVEGVRVNMKGEPIDGYNDAVDTVLIVARQGGVFTAGIGDGGNEAGIGHLDGVPRGRYQGREFDFKSTVESDLGVTAWNSNLGAIATAMELARLTGNDAAMPTADDVRRSIDGAVTAGAIDGVTRESSRSVDGFSDRVHVLFADLYRQRLDASGPS